MIDVRDVLSELEMNYALCMREVETASHGIAMALAYAILVNKMLRVIRDLVREVLLLQQEVGELRSELHTRN